MQDKEKEEKKEKELSVDELKQKLQECEKLKNEYLAGWQRSRADLINYKKEEMERVGDILKYANEGLILKMLPILDNFEIGIKEIVKLSLSDNKEKELMKGLIQIREQFVAFLKEYGIEEIKSVGEKFDPKYHEVVSEIEALDKENGTIIEEIQKGYIINGRLLRPSKVKVAK